MMKKEMMMKKKMDPNNLDSIFMNLDFL